MKPQHYLCFSTEACKLTSMFALCAIVVQAALEVICDDEAVPIREGAGGGFYKFSFGHINVYPPTSSV